MQHLCIVAGICRCCCVIEQSQLYHQLTAVTNAEREGVLTRVELIEGLLCLRVEEEGTSPSLCRTQYVGVRETAAEGYHINLFQCLTTCYEVSHRNILHVKASLIERPSHLTLRVGTLLTDDGSNRTLAFWTWSCLEAVTLQCPCYRILLVVLKALSSLAVEALLSVEEVRGRIPYIAQLVDVEVEYQFARSYLCIWYRSVRDCLGNSNLALCTRSTYLAVTNAGILQNLLHAGSIAVANLYYDTRVLGKEHLHDVAFLYLVEVDVKTTLGVCKTHLKETGDDTTCRDIVSGKYQAFANHLLYCHESISEVFRILYCWNIAANLSLTLCKGRAAQLQLVE